MRRSLRQGDQLQPEVVPQLTHLWQAPFGTMMLPHSGQVGASDRAMKLATSLLEPLMILGVGSVIGVIVIAMLLPIFQISTFVK